VFEDRKSNSGPNYHEALKTAENLKFMRISTEEKILAENKAQPLS
jgi:hypothetical protein